MNPVTDPEGFAAGMTIITILIVAVSVIVPLGITGFIFYIVFKKLNQNKQLVAQGEPAQAQVLSLSETGTSLNNQPEVVMALQVQRQGAPPYQANATAFISQLHIPRLQPGSIIPVKVDPGNPLQVAIDLGALMSMPIGAPMMGQQYGSAPQQQYGSAPQQQYGSAPQQYGAPPPQQQQYGSAPQQYGAPPQQYGSSASGMQACPYCQQPLPVGSASCPHCHGQLR